MPAKSGFGAYPRLLREPGALTLGLYGVVGRFPIAMRSLGCLLLVAAISGSLAGAGVVAAAMLISQGLASPVLGRLADRVGQRKVLLTTCAVHAVALSTLVTAIMLGAPLPLLVLAAVATGCASVSFTSFMRARWAALVEQGTLRTAYALESVLDETIFLLGPLLVTVLATAVHPAAGLVACVAFTTVGSIAVALHTRSEPVVEPLDEGGGQRAISVTGVQVLMVAYAGMGFLLGAIDVTMVAFAREQGTPGMGGVFLSLTAVGSLAAGAVFGAVDWKLPQEKLLVATTTVLVLGAVPLAFAGSSLVMAGLAVVAGIAIAPGLIAGSTLLEALAPKGSLSEGFSWLSSAGALGIALGTGAGGWLAESGGFDAAAWAAVGGGAVAVALSAAGQPALRRRRPVREPGMAAREQ
ncbi:MFS transporter [Actinokineospora globicatena]|uniref:MFS transporter n=1 Tax=Actinokineospora globicatena TaxID=103729 RepID=UPI0020A4886B|nr:MFS transporter [Actinokineospora globicatena]MCP2303376.1 putative arabinose efflux permease, MFS family [Actinokineospora globicatena]GLW79490.1 MFS transporter [Actinokineospora globicatena]